MENNTYPQELLKLLKMVDKLKKNQAKLDRLIKKIGTNNNKKLLND